MKFPKFPQCIGSAWDRCITHVCVCYSIRVPCATTASFQLVNSKLWQDFMMQVSQDTFHLSLVT